MLAIRVGPVVTRRLFELQNIHDDMHPKGLQSLSSNEIRPSRFAEKNGADDNTHIHTVLIHTDVIFLTIPAVPIV